MAGRDHPHRLRRGASALWLVIAAAQIIASLSMAADVMRSFAAFDARLEIDIEDGEIELTAEVKLDNAADKTVPANQPMSIRLRGGSSVYALQLPAGSFKSEGRDRYFFRGTVDGVKILASLGSKQGAGFELELITEGARLNGMANPVTVSLELGGRSGSKTLRAKIE